MEQLTEADFDGRKLRRPGLVVVCFQATWCGFCHRFVPTFEALDGTVDASLALADISDEESPLWDRFGVETVPTVVTFREGDLAWRIDAPLGLGLDHRALDLITERVKRGSER